MACESIVPLAGPPPAYQLPDFVLTLVSDLSSPLVGSSTFSLTVTASFSSFPSGFGFSIIIGVVLECEDCKATLLISVISLAPSVAPGTSFDAGSEKGWRSPTGTKPFACRAVSTHLLF